MLELLAGGGLVFAGWLLGRFGGRRQPGRQPARTQPTEARCGCRHALSYHDPKTNECHAVMDIASSWTQYGIPNAWTGVRCNCRQYTGPRPVESLFATPLLPPAENE